MKRIGIAVAAFAATALAAAPIFAATPLGGGINVVNETGGPNPNTADWSAVSSALNQALTSKLATKLAQSSDNLEVRVTGMQMAAKGPSELSGRVMVILPPAPTNGGEDNYPSVLKVYDLTVTAKGGTKAPQMLANSFADYVSAHL